MNFSGARRILEERQESRMRLGLGRLRRVLKRLGDPQEGLSCIHVAGTNGKGSTCAILEAVLRAAGYRTGLYLSPHVNCLRERIQVGGRFIPESAFARLLEKTGNADPRQELTYFELLTCIAFLYFQEMKAEVVVLETGLGGRLDATNVIARPLASVITSIGFDHTQWLGSTLSKIAAEKSGIIKPGSPVFCPRLPGEALRVVTRQAKGNLTVVRRSWKTVAVRWRENRQILSDGSRRYELSLLGSRQGRNAALARTVLEGLKNRLPVPEAAWRRGLAQVRLPARFEVKRLGSRTAIFDGAHNPEAIQELRRTLEASPWRGRRLQWIMALMRDKDCAKIVGELAPRLKDVTTVSLSNPRARAAADLARELRRRAPGAEVRVAADAAEALRQWLRDPAGPRTAVVCGSFFLAGAAHKTFNGGKHV